MRTIAKDRDHGLCEWFYWVGSGRIRLDWLVWLDFSAWLALPDCLDSLVWRGLVLIWSIRSDWTGADSGLTFDSRPGATLLLKAAAATAAGAIR